MKESVDRCLLLAGRPPIHDFVQFVKTRALDGEQADERVLTDEWRKAALRVAELQSTDKSWADQSSETPLPDHLTMLAKEAMRDAVLDKCLGFLPYRWAYVELDRVIVWQPTINLTYVEEFKASLRPSLTDVDRLRVALGDASSPPPTRAIRQNGSSFIFTSTSRDLRPLGITALEPRSVQGYEPYGYSSSVLAIFVGRGPNLLHALRVRDRVILLNGTHRAYALRSLGTTHVPCVIQEALTDEDIALTAVPALRNHSHLYLHSPRPPLFKDYFDPTLTKVVTVPQTESALEIQINIHESRLPARRV